MRPLAIQFACRKRAVRQFGCVSLAIGLTALGAGALHYGETRTAAREGEAVVRKLADEVKRTAQAPQVNAAPALSEAGVRAVNSAIAKLNLPWRDLFGALESAKPDTVALLALEPDGRRRMLVMHAEAKSPEHMIDFAERLRTISVFEYAVLTRHELREQDPHRPYRFTLELRWREEL
jgi:hypothetical protein